MISPLGDYLHARLGDVSRVWFDAVMQAEDTATLASAFTLASRKIDQTDANDAEASSDPGWLVAGRPLDELVRVAVLLRAASYTQTPLALVDEWYRTGDDREKCSIVRALALMPSPGKYVDIALSAARSTAEALFEALACENPYPAERFSDEAFVELLARAVSMNLPLRRIVDLEGRLSAAAFEVLERHAAERAAAGAPSAAGVAELLSSRAARSAVEATQSTEDP